jgi:hypothetical protein
MSIQIVRNRAFKDYKQGMKIAGIAEKYGVPFNTVKSWARRYWKLPKGAEVTSESHRKVPPRPHGAPVGNRNRFIHGAYVKLAPHNITAEEIELLRYSGFMRGSVWHDEILLCRIEERRLFQSIIALDKSFENRNHFERITVITAKTVGGVRRETKQIYPSYCEIRGYIEQQLTRLSGKILKYALLWEKERKSGVVEHVSEEVISAPVTVTPAQTPTETA